ncbi:MULTISPECIES: SLC13 family permease [Salinibaculum]|uniref:SLC13 family permease n=1 Tax=Salinibaculum TaxID=2732368 RepID=UPI0030D39141
MALSTGALVVFVLIGVAVALFVTELLPPDMTAIAVLVALAVLEPYTEVAATDAIAGFASPAVVTIIAMYILSDAVEGSGVVDWLGAHLARATHGDDTRLLGATTTSTGLFAGVVNNTPVVAVFIPMVSDLAEEAGVSPSKFLMPLSFAAMLGGTLTLVGSSINLLASDVSEQLIDHPLGMFEFTPLGVLVFGVGVVYLVTVGYWLTPARLAPERSVTEAYDLERNLAQVRVRPDSPLVGRTAADLFLDADLELDLDVLQIDRERAVVADEEDVEGLQTRAIHDTYIAGSGQPIASGDVLTVRADRQVLNRFAEAYDLRQFPRERVDAERLAAEAHPGMLVEAVVPPDSDWVDSTPEAEKLTERFETKVIARRRGDEVAQSGLSKSRFRAGDTLLLQTTESAIEFFYDEDDLIPLDGAPDPTPDIEPEAPPELDARAPLSVGILVVAVLLAAATPLSIPVTALGGVVAMVVTGCLSPADAYDAVSWPVVFLLAGILPLGVALQRTGGAAFLGDAIGGAAVGLAPVLVVTLLYLVTALLAAVVTPVATVVLLGPVAVDTARTLGVDPFAFVLATLFGASAAYITPIGYQTNLMVYGPGGYRFTDYLRVGGPLLALLSVVTTVGITVIYGL